MRDVPVAAQDHFAAARRESMQMWNHALEKFEFHCQPLLGRRARRQVERDHAQVAELRFDVAAFRIDLGKTQALDYAIGLMRAVERYSAVAFLLRTMKMPVQAPGIEHAGGQVARMRFHLLQAHDVGLLRGHPRQ